MSRSPEAGGDVVFPDYASLEAAYAKQEVHPGDLKTAVEVSLNKLLEPIRKTFESPELKKLVEKAYPAPSKQSKPIQTNLRESIHSPVSIPANFIIN